ncbi:thiol-disulfide oxidoreductase DCC family protein [Bradymonas sediminis]|uniref:Uncharacterized protein n=1 Tax=Bradymonas sediminis TaxID=1548548 RepID=A0A2Z4FJB3_9DELT|nr:DCC1-like thiol-disulfide oxidoreductase family protein [Bradymonas sediminis]AWV88930.1 hypothetical protein DN745_06080 [Bradymonas sediminis]TDP71939.1 putative DCC family thiol-disulfide oxidoreductase YuxK [Bradymonas sediminis]
MSETIEIDDTEGLEAGRLDRPALLWDGKCGFCKRALGHIIAQAGDRIRYVSYQSFMPYFPEFREEDLAREIHFVEPDGSVYRGAAAIFRALSMRPQGSYLMGIYRRSAVFAGLSEWGYRRVARNRQFASRVAKFIPGW